MEDNLQKHSKMLELIFIKTKKLLFGHMDHRHSRFYLMPSLDLGLACCFLSSWQKKNAWLVIVLLYR